MERKMMNKVPELVPEISIDLFKKLYVDSACHAKDDHIKKLVDDHL